MQHNSAENLQFRANIEFVTKSAPCFKSETYPPEDDFVMSIDSSGNIISSFGDDLWDFRPYGARHLCRFSGIEQSNKQLFKQAMFYIIYSHLFPGKYESLKSPFYVLKSLFEICSKHNINATNINRFPRVIEEFATTQAPSTFQHSVWYFDRLLKNKMHVGFELLNRNSIVLLSRFRPTYTQGQSAYIPPKIWTSFIRRLDNVLNDFIAHQDSIKNVYFWIASHYFYNSNDQQTEKIAPKLLAQKGGSLRNLNRKFQDIVKSEGLDSLLTKYQTPTLKAKQFTIKTFGSFLNNIIAAYFFYVLYFSLMRKSEALSLQSDCLLIEKDERLGEIILLVGETTKTDPDSNDRWIVNKSVIKAINISRDIVSWKLKFIDAKKLSTAYSLFQRVDIWNKAAQNNKVRSIDKAGSLIMNAKTFFDVDNYEISEEEYHKALALTPTLVREAWFKIGGIWKFSFHQFRRTLAVVFAVNNVSPTTNQFQLKHSTREQQYYYMNNYGRLQLNTLASQEVINEYYNEMAKNIIAIVEQSDGKLFPYRKPKVTKEVINFIVSVHPTTPS